MSTNEDIRAEAISNENIQAEQESDAFTNRRLAIKEQVSEHRRNEWMRYLISIGTVTVLGIAFFLVSCALITVAVHYLAPLHWRWLEDHNLQTVTTILGSGSIFSVISLYVRDRLTQPINRQN